jgi:monoamine oxidase
MKTDDSSVCTKYRAKRVIVTVPVSILRGNGYSINFQPPLNNIAQFPSFTGQYNKVFFRFNTSFWGPSGALNQFIGIIRSNQYRDVCTHWQNVHYNIPGSNILMCTLTDSGMAKFKSLSLTTDDLLDPLRDVYGNNTVNVAYQDVIMARWDLDPSSGYGAYASFRAGYNFDQYYALWGGRSHDGFTQGAGYNAVGQWIVHLSGAASCFEYNEQIDGAYYSGIRSARNVLKSFPWRFWYVRYFTACEDF